MFIFDTMPQLSATYKNERCTSVYAPLFKNDYIDDVNAHHTVQSRRQPYARAFARYGAVYHLSASLTRFRSLCALHSAS